MKLDARWNALLGSGLAAAVVLALVFYGGSGQEEANDPSPGVLRLGFDSGSSLPEGWVIGATNPTGSLAEWRVAADEAAPSLPHVLSLTTAYDLDDRVYNLFWRPESGFLDGELEAKLRADSGVIDQGGGLAWRMVDVNNYYAVRYNPLEKNLWAFAVEQGRRRTLAVVPDVDIPAGTWLSLRVVQRGNRFECWLSGDRLISSRDSTYSRPGGVGFWTKTDAKTSFDDFVMTRSQ